MPHQVCKHCGFYKGNKILVTKYERSLARGKARKAKKERQKMEQPSQEVEKPKE